MDSKLILWFPKDTDLGGLGPALLEARIGERRNHYVTRVDVNPEMGGGTELVITVTELD